ILTWVRLPRLPIHYFNKLAVSCIGNYIGKTVRLDLATAEGARARYARVCVEIDVTKPLLGKYMIENREFHIEYESLENICFSCGFYGHKEAQCELHKMPHTESSTPVVLPEVEKAKEGDAGSWMTVCRWNKKREQKVPPPTANVPNSGSRFVILTDSPSSESSGPKETRTKPPSPTSTPVVSPEAEALNAILDKAMASNKSGRVTLAQSVLAAIPAYAMQTSVLPSTTCSEIDKRIHSDGGWDFVKLLHWLSEEGVCFVVGMAPPKQNRGEDDWAWGCETNGKFSIRTAYDLISDTERGKLRRCGRQFGSGEDPTGYDIFCGFQVENSVHVLRDCAFAAEVWRRVGGFDLNDTIWSDTIKAWMLHHLSSDSGLLFGIICWSLWRARNSRVFTDANEQAASVAIRASSWCRTVEAAMDREARVIGDLGGRTLKEISWDPGPAGWVTVNTDGAANRETGMAAAGGLIRNEMGFCSAAFSINIGRCSVTRAELRERGWRKVELQVDSLAAIQLIEAAGTPRHQHATEVLDIRELLLRDWQICIRHTYR
ncbi:Putative ribonuclease H protein At1g65750, partial [Linum perenne]